MLSRLGSGVRRWGRGRLKCFDLLGGVLGRCSLQLRKALRQQALQACQQGLLASAEHLLHDLVERGQWLQARAGTGQAQPRLIAQRANHLLHVALQFSVAARKRRQARLGRIGPGPGQRVLRNGVGQGRAHALHLLLQPVQGLARRNLGAARGRAAGLLGTLQLDGVKSAEPQPQPLGKVHAGRWWRGGPAAHEADQSGTAEIAVQKRSSARQGAIQKSYFQGKGCQRSPLKGHVLETMRPCWPAKQTNYKQISSANLASVTFLTFFPRRLRLWPSLAALAAAVLLSACSVDESPSDHEIARIPTLAPISGPTPMVRMNAEEKPDGPVVVRQDKEVYYSCAGLVGEWFLKLVVAEMNFLARQEELERMDGSACAVSLGLKGMNTDRIKVHLFRNATEANECLFKRRCDMARNVALIPTQTAILRSYFLSDQLDKRFVQHCLAPPNTWHKGVSCEYIGKAVALGVKADGS